MNDMIRAYLLALGASMSFSIAAQVFTHYSRAISAIWMVYFKACIALACFAAAVLVLRSSFDYPLYIMALFFASGLIGLGIGDLGLLTAMKRLGPGRAMMIVGVHPLVMAVFSYFCFGQTIEPKNLVAIVFMIACIFVVSLESAKKEGNWAFGSIALVLMFVILDSIGIMLTRYGTDNSGADYLEVSALRCLGAVTCFAVWGLFRPIRIVEGLKKQSGKSLAVILFGSVLGTFVALCFITEAIRISDSLATVSGICITVAVFSGTFECIIEKHRPSLYLIISFLLMCAGFCVLIS
jgi:drug/metabolite transporter (DMT)-like permease